MRLDANRSGPSSHSDHLEPAPPKSLLKEGAELLSMGLAAPVLFARESAGGVFGGFSTEGLVMGALGLCAGVIAAPFISLWGIGKLLAGAAQAASQASEAGARALFERR